jgi:hypothetical protein
VDILVVGCEPHVIINIALGLERCWRDDLTHAKWFGDFADGGDVFHRIFELGFSRFENGSFNQMGMLAKFGEFVHGLNGANACLM